MKNEIDSNWKISTSIMHACNTNIPCCSFALKLTCSEHFFHIFIIAETDIYDILLLCAQLNLFDGSYFSNNLEVAAYLTGK